MDTEFDKEFDEGEEDVIARMKEVTTLPGYHKLPMAEEVRSQRYHKKVALFAKLSGLEGIEEDSEVGKLLQEKAELFQRMASKDLPAEYVLKLIYVAVEAEMAKNAAYTWMMSLRPPKKLDDDLALAHRQSYATASSAYKGFAQLLIQVMGLLQSGKPNQVEASSLASKLSSLPKMSDLAKKSS